MLGVDQLWIYNAERILHYSLLQCNRFTELSLLGCRAIHKRSGEGIEPISVRIGVSSSQHVLRAGCGISIDCAGMRKVLTSDSQGKHSNR